MKISSRPPGSNLSTTSNVLLLSDEQLQLIVALIASCRLGKNTSASKVAFELLEIFENSFDADLLDRAYDAFDLQVTVEDDQDNVVFSSVGSGHFVTLEV